MISIRSITTENDLAEEFISAFRARRLPEKFFYWFPLSVRAWLALCSDGEYRNYIRSRSLIARGARDLAEAVGGDSLEVVSLGSGQGDKDLLLLEALREGGRRVSYLPIDTSQALLEIACREAEAAGFPTAGYKADLGRPEHLQELAPPPGAPPRLVLLLGNTLGGLDPIELAGRLRSFLRPQDLLLVDGEIYAGPETMGGYDNPLNRAFAWAPLNAVGIGEEDGELVFEMASDDRLPGLHLIPKHFRPRHPVRVRMGGEEFALDEGERLEMSHSYKYAPETFFRILVKAALAPRWQATSDDERFLMVLAAPDGPST